MITLGQCRIGNVILYNAELTRITTLTREKIGFFHRLHPDKEIFRPTDSWEIGGVELNKALLTEILHFVEYKGPGYNENVSNEFTEGRIILRVNEDSIAVFQPNDFPWAQAINLHMDYICTINYLHQLQNIYIDLFGEELHIERI